MTKDLLAKLEEIDLAILNDVVQQDQGSPSFEISEWFVKRLSTQGLMSPDGLWLFSGQGSDHNGIRSWSVVLKIIERTEHEPPLSDMWHWQREIILTQSRFTERMPGPVRAAHFYRVDETPDGAWLWLEYIESKRDKTWVLDDYCFAAHQLGKWNGVWLKEIPLPKEPWLARRHYRTFLADADPQRVWRFPLHQEYISSEDRDRCEQLWADREVFFNLLETLPQCFSHFDSNRRNLFVRRGKNEEDELVLVDWAMCGLGPLGAELYALVGMSSVLSEVPPSDLSDLDSAVFESYLRGLRQSGWSGKADMVRLGYLAWLSMWLGVGFPGQAVWWCSADNHRVALKAFGLAEEELYLQWLQIMDYALDCADEARLLMKELGI